MNTGKILWKSERDGNGIIITSDKKEFYFDTSVCLGFKSLKSNDLVSFEQNDKIKDCLCAKNVLFSN